MTVAIAPALHIPNIKITPVRRETRHGDDAITRPTSRSGELTFLDRVPRATGVFGRFVSSDSNAGAGDSNPLGRHTPS
jgi:hypothetical protein